MTDDIEKDDFTEIVDAHIGRVDLVGGAANGHKFLIAKSGEGMVPADMVRDLIEKADEAAVTEGVPAVADVEKADLEVGDLVEDSPAGSTADSAPGSTDWEQKDGDTANNALAVLTRVREVVQWLAGREMQEATAGESDGDDNAWDLQDACAAIDCAIDLIAPYASGELIEAEMSEEAEGVLKSVEGLNPRALGIAESSQAIVKAGRVLSASNESALRDAVDSIQKVLASLPAAPEVDNLGQVEKADETEDNLEVVKADAPEPGDDDSALVLVYDAKGNIIGAVDPAEITQFAATPAGAEPDKPAEPETNDQTAEPVGAEPTSADLKPAPASAAGVGSTDQVEKTSEPDVELSADELLKAAEDGDDPRMKAWASIVKGYQEQVEKLKSLPAMPKAVANGAGMTTVLKGQTQDAPVDDTRVAELRKQAQSQNVHERVTARDELSTLLAAAFARTRDGGAPIGR